MDVKDSRFADTAIRKGFISFEDLRNCIAAATSNGTSQALGEFLLDQGVISKVQFEQISKALKGEEGSGVMKMSDDRFCEIIIKRGLLSYTQLDEALHLLTKYKKGDKQLKSLDEILIDLGLLTARQIQQLRGADAKPRVNLSESTHSKLGELALRRGYITEEQLADCLSMQADQLKKGNQRRLGEILIGRGYLDADQLEELLVAHQSETRSLKILGYEILTKIGAGGMGEIYKARQVSVDRIVAIKILSSRHAKDREYMERFIHEAKLLAKLDHPYIVKAIDAGQSGETFYYVMEFVDGSTVFKLLNTKKKLPERDCLKIGLYVGHALEHASKHKLVHRDIKPTNIMITKDGVVKLCDLGIAKLLDSQAGPPDFSTKGYAVGSPYYISPESCLGKDVDIRSDIYSLGATLYHCATGKPAFSGATAAAVLAKHIHQEPDTPRDLNPEISEHFSKAIMKMMRKVPEDRYQTPGELAKDLEAIMKGAAPTEPMRRPPSMNIRTARYEPKVVYKTKISWGAVIAAVFATVLICGGIATYLLAKAEAIDVPFLK